MTPHDHGSVAAPGPVAWLAVGLLAAVLLVPYVIAARSRRGRTWSRGRVLTWTGGVIMVGVAASPPLVAQSHADARVHMTQHLLLGMAGPLLLVLAAPVTLVLRSASRPVRTRLVRLLRSRAVHVVSHPVVAAGLNIGGLLMIYRTPVHEISTRSAVGLAAVGGHLLLAGALFAWSIAGPDPAPRRPGLSTRLVVLVVAGGVHAWLAKLLYARAGSWPAGSPYEIDEAQQAAVLMYYGGDAVEVALAVALLAAWYRARGRRRRPDPAVRDDHGAVERPGEIAWAGRPRSG